MTSERDEEFYLVRGGPRSALLRTACLMTGDRQHGEDLVQTTLAKGYGAWAKVRWADEPLAYVRRIRPAPAPLHIGRGTTRAGDGRGVRGTAHRPVRRSRGDVPGGT